MKSNIVATVTISKEEYSTLEKGRNIMARICGQFTDECSSECPFAGVCQIIGDEVGCESVAMDDVIREVVRTAVPIVDAVAVKVED